MTGHDSDNQPTTHDPLPIVDMGEVRAAIHADDAARFLTAITGSNIDNALQHVASGAARLLGPAAEHVALLESLIIELQGRSSPGDDELAEDLLARLRGEPLAGLAVPVDLEMLTDILEGDPELMSSGYLDLHTGAVFPRDLADPAVVGEDLAIDVESNPKRYLPVEHTYGRHGWEDMAVFAQSQSDAQLQARLDEAIRGKGAFRNFRDAIEEAELVDSWRTFSTDRQFGRARQFLATESIRAV